MIKMLSDNDQEKILFAFDVLLRDAEAREAYK
jgi:hypothetical protein